MSYEEKCVEADIELLQLMGYTEVRQAVFHKNRVSGVSNGERVSFPRWTLDDAAAFQLMVEHGLRVMVDIHPDGCDCVEVDEDINYTTFIYNFKDFPTKAAAVRYAVVQATITKLKG